MTLDNTRRVLKRDRKRSIEGAEVTWLRGPDQSRLLRDGSEVKALARHG